MINYQYKAKRVAAYQGKKCFVGPAYTSVSKWREYMQKPSPSEYTEEMLKKEEDIATAEYKEFVDEKDPEEKEWERLDYYFAYFSYLVARKCPKSYVERELYQSLKGVDVVRWEALVNHNYSKVWNSVEELESDPKKDIVVKIKHTPDNKLIGYDINHKIVKPTRTPTKSECYRRAYLRHYGEYPEDKATND